jgi:hypothetical protein
MKSRRDFFRQFVGQAGKLREDFMGAESVPQKRLSELPDELTGKIVPVFFPDEKWQVRDRMFILPADNNHTGANIDLSVIEMCALEYFRSGLSLSQIAEEIKSNSGLHISEIFQTVKELFFRLAELNVCHPLDPEALKDLPNNDRKDNDGQLQDK